MRIYSLLLYFFIYSFLGWCTEVAYATVKERRFVNRGFLNGPWCPIYGVGVSAVVTLLDGFRDSLLLLYLSSLVLVTLIEGMTGVIMDKIFHHKWWDYTGLPLNIGGYVCLLFSVVWGVACVVIVKAVHPLVGDLCALIPLGAGILILSVLSAALAADLTVTVGGILRWNRQLDAMEKIAADLRELSGKMGENIYENVMDTMELREKVDAAVEEKRQQLAEQRQLLAETKEQAAELRRKYKELADRETNVIFGGRLAEYKYYDMHHIVEKALNCF